MKGWMSGWCNTCWKERKLTPAGGMNVTSRSGVALCVELLYITFYMQSFGRRSYPERLKVSTGTFPPRQVGWSALPRDTTSFLHGQESNRQPSDRQPDSLTAQPSDLLGQETCAHMLLTDRVLAAAESRIWHGSQGGTKPHPLYLSSMKAFFFGHTFIAGF